MNEKQEKDAQKKFEQYQNKSLTSEDLEKAEAKADYLGEQKNNFKLLIEMVKSHWKGDFVIDKLSLAIIIGAIIYVASPLDAIPDMIPVLGWIDDASILALAISKVQDTLKKYVAFKKNNNLDHITDK